jgi:hypothetical protein
VTVAAPPIRSRSPSPKGTSAPVFGAGGSEAAVGRIGAVVGTGAGAGAAVGVFVTVMPMSPPVEDEVVDAVLVVCGADCEVVEPELVVAPEPRLPRVGSPLLRPFSPVAPSALEVPADELCVELEVEVVVDPSWTRGVPSVDVEPELVLVVPASVVVVVVVLLEVLVVPASALLLVVPASVLLVVVPASVLEVVVELEVVVVVPPPVDPPPVDPLPGSPLGAGQSIQKVVAFWESWVNWILKW